MKYSNPSMRPDNDEFLKININRNIHVIKMKNDAVDIYKNELKPLENEMLFLFDIDECLYTCFEHDGNEEEVEVMKLYEKYRNNDLSIPDYHNSHKTNFFYPELFYDAFGMEPSTFWEIYPFPQFEVKLKKNYLLKDALNSLPGRCWCFTNGIEKRARLILNGLGITECFEGIVCADDQSLDFVFKPKPKSFEIVSELFKTQGKEHNVYFFDDKYENVLCAKSIGWSAYEVNMEKGVLDVVNNLLSNLSTINNKI